MSIRITIVILCLALPILSSILPENLNYQLPEIVRKARGCPMSPYSKFLTDQEQMSLHELITEARGKGADEGTVQGHIDSYLSTILAPDRLAQFKKANEEFEQNRRGKRSAEKQRPEKVYDLIDYYDGNRDRSQYAAMFQESIRSHRRL